MKGILDALIVIVFLYILQFNVFFVCRDGCISFHLFTGFYPETSEYVHPEN